MKSILFDLDNTLLDRASSLIGFCHWQATSSLGIDNSEKFVGRFVELDSNGSVWKDQVYQCLKGEFSIPQSVDELVDEYLNHFRNFCAERPGASDAVRQLAREGYKIGLVSNGKSPFQEENLSALGIADFFDSIIVSEAVGCRKPDPSIFELACKELAVSPDQCIFIGDNPVADIRSAAKVGMYTVFIPSELYGDRCAEADAVCRSYAELLSIIENAESRSISQQ
ncbi:MULTISPECIES: HAD family hydrolase [unclassified Marinimicrobium]|jgi:putative hydrolase of the HAD superfamily|uniref:HAD family hydrolase n=1 Tax=unclassified Marinimicrobium TaxID=2632100 RepID=UPI000C455448|nr:MULTISPECIES: HAD family hydrolase [unclassified Marinimicrobium]MAN53297.1 haloacid dehalogenase [Marinimicrobium sp.]|tara:strand:+ start:129 stop:803 length:675 start_codon:yes stop_codon:yes gene_type:complete